MTGVRQIPNLLTALRLVAAPVTAWLILQGSDTAALAVFACAGLSDALDGFLAKRYGLASRFGAWLDPAADKLLMLACFVTLVALQVVPLWLAVLVIGRDVAIVAGIILAALMGAPLRMTPLLAGKASTAVQVAYIALILLLLALGLDRPRIETIAATVTAAVTVLSWLAYAQVWLRAVVAGRRTA